MSFQDSHRLSQIYFRSSGSEAEDQNKMPATNPNAHTYVNGTDGGLPSVNYDV